MVGGLDGQHVLAVSVDLQRPRHTHRPQVLVDGEGVADVARDDLVADLPVLAVVAVDGRHLDDGSARRGRLKQLCLDQLGHEGGRVVVVVRDFDGETDERGLGR